MHYFRWNRGHGEGGEQWCGKGKESEAVARVEERAVGFP